MTKRTALILLITLSAVFLGGGITALVFSFMQGENMFSVVILIIGLLLILDCISVWLVGYIIKTAKNQRSPKRLRIVSKIAIIVPLVMLAIGCASIGIYFLSDVASTYVSLTAFALQIIVLSACTYVTSMDAIRIKMQEDREQTERELSELLDKRYNELNNQKQQNNQTNDENG